MEQPRRRSSSLLDLPQDIQGRMIAAVLRGRNESRALEHALVCRQWSTLARTCTEELEITNERYMRDFPKVLRELAPWAPGLRSLRLSPAVRIQLPESAVTNLLQLCQGLESLHLRPEIVQESSASTVGEHAAAGGVPAGPLSLTLKRLDINHGGGSALLPLLARLPHLEALVLVSPLSDLAHLREWCPHLRALWLFDDYLEVPPSISVLVGLRKLQLSGEISTPFNLRSLSSLEELSVYGGADFETIPDLSPQSRIKHLKLHGFFRNIPYLPCFQTLETFELSNVEERIFPPQAVLPKLKHLSVSPNLEFPSLSEEHWDLPSLKSLIIGDSTFSADALPSSLGACRALSAVTIEGRLDSFPSHISSSCPLCSLDLSSLTLTTLPDDFTLRLDSLPLLTKLQVNCQLLGLMHPGPQSQLPKLQVLSVKCPPREDDDGHPVACSRTTKLPHWVALLSSLTTLDISDCGCLVSFPPALLDLPRLDSKSRDGIRNGWIVIREGSQN